MLRGLRKNLCELSIVIGYGSQLIKVTMSAEKIIHIGLWKLKTDADPNEVARVDKLVKSFKTKIPGIDVAHAGPLETFDLPMEIVDSFGISSDVSILARGYNHVLYIVFEDKESRQKYDTALPHLELSPIMIPLIENGMNGVLTIDFSMS